MGGRKKILFVIGSPNQTTQMHQIASSLKEYDCYFTQLYSTHPIIKAAINTGLLEHTIFSGEFRKQADEYLQKNQLNNDYAASALNNHYDLAVLCTDIIVPGNLRTTKTVWIQEGMTDAMTSWAKWVRKLNLPRYFAAGTALNGTSNLCDIYCVASEGYRDHFTKYGMDASKIFITGIPNYDNINSFLQNDFPYHNYVLVATSDIREVLGKDDRKKFIENSVRIANGRKLIFKLHPNEKKERAISEIKKYAPDDTLIFTDGDTNHMIANCDELITQYSTVVYIGMVLGKKVHSYFNLNELKKLIPLQNGGTSAKNIAHLCRSFIEFNGSNEAFRTTYKLPSESYSGTMKKNRKVVTVVQARTGSTRLPGKILKPLAGRPLLLRQMERVLAARLSGTVVVATTEGRQDDILEKICFENNLECFRGHETDLLDRHYQVALKYNADVVVKIPSDCPLISPDIIDRVIGFYLDHEAEYDFVSNLHPASFPDGNDVEVMSMNSLENAWKNAHKKMEREHTTPYIWDNPELFRIGNVKMDGGKDYSMMHRWTIDYPEDYIFIKTVYDQLYPRNPRFGMKDILELVEARKDIYSINSHYAGVNWYRNHLTELRTISEKNTKTLISEA